MQTDEHAHSHPDAEVRRLESLAAWWDEQAQQIEQDRFNLRYLWAAGVPAALLATYFLDWRFGLGALAVTTLGFVQGLYLCTVHRWEYQYNLRETKGDLWTARKATRKRSKTAWRASPEGLPPHPQANNVTPLDRS